MWTVRVNGGVFAPTLAGQLVEAVTEVLNLAGTEDTSDAHQLAVVMLVVASRVHVATVSLPRAFTGFAGFSCFWLTNVEWVSCWVWRRWSGEDGPPQNGAVDGDAMVSIWALSNIWRDGAFLS